MIKIMILSTLLTLAFTSCTKSERSLTEQLNEKKALSSKMMPSEVKKLMTKALSDLKDSGIEQKAINKGVIVPEFTVNEAPFSNIYKNGPVIVKFYRGSWCPYCQLELKDYEKHKSKFDERNYKIIVFTPDTEMEIKKFKKKQGISFDIYQDKDNQIAKKFGIAFKLDEKLLPIYKKFGIDLEQSQGNGNNELPLPGTYVIGTDGKVQFAFIDADYTKRLDPLDLLKKI